MFAKNMWYVAAWSEDIKDKPHSMTVAGEPIVFYRKSDGELVALLDRCCHRAAPLSLGRVEADALRCMYHGLKFSADGVCIEAPGQDKIPDIFCVKKYAVKEYDGWVWVWLGSHETADTALIPRSPLGDSDYRFQTGHLDYDANYQLINDNLTDFSHVTYVHEATFARGRDDWAENKPNIDNLDNGVRIWRWVPNSPPMPVPGLEGMVDVWSSYDYLLPGIFLMEIGNYPLGTAEASNFERPKSAPILSQKFAQAVTPMTEKTTRYFFGNATPKTASTGVDEIGWQITLAAFTEDKTMIEAQQKTIDGSPDMPLLNTGHDAALMRFRRLLSAKISAENPS